MESSMRNRISRLKKKGSPFVKFADPEVDYRRVVGANLRQPTSHVEYEGTLTAENRDLLVREGRDRCADLLKESALRDPRVLSQGEEGPKIVQEWLPDYFDELRKRQEAVEVTDPNLRHEGQLDLSEILRLDRMEENLQTYGNASDFVRDFIEFLSNLIFFFLVFSGMPLPLCRA
jgi:hypothetical protein